MFQKNNRNFDFYYYLLLLSLNLFFILEKKYCFFFILLLVFKNGTPKKQTEWRIKSKVFVCYLTLEDPAVANFREYLKIKTVHPKPEYETAAIWLKKQAEEIGLEVSEKEVVCFFI